MIYNRIPLYSTNVWLNHTSFYSSFSLLSSPPHQPILLRPRHLRRVCGEGASGQGEAPAVRERRRPPRLLAVLLHVGLWTVLCHDDIVSGSDANNGEQHGVMGGDFGKSVGDLVTADELRDGGNFLHLPVFISVHQSKWGAGVDYGVSQNAERPQLQGGG